VIRETKRALYQRIGQIGETLAHAKRTLNAILQVTLCSRSVLLRHQRLYICLTVIDPVLVQRNDFTQRPYTIVPRNEPSECRHRNLNFATILTTYLWRDAWCFAHGQALGADALCTRFTLFYVPVCRASVTNTKCLYLSI
jgi:hypothetical protein